MITNKFTYTKCPRIDTISGRKYSTPDGGKVSSVTTILDKTKPKEEREVLQKWKNRVGQTNAQMITTEASSRGTRLHSFLEGYIKNDVLADPGDNPYSKQSHKMAKVIIDNAFGNVDESWGCEVPLYYPELYAGTCDYVGVWKGKPAIMDFKQSNKCKKREWITGYFLQLAAYAQAHNFVHGTNITTGVILMCTADFQYQEFVIEEEEFEHFSTLWCNRLEQFFKL